MSTSIWDSLVVHCSATRPSMDIGREEIDRWHKERGWSGIGYHMVIRRDGTIELGRPIERMGAHVRGHNEGTVGVCLIGGLNESGDPAPEFEPEQMDALTRVVDWFDLPIVGHHDLNAGKACPSFDVAHWQATGQLRERTA